MVEKKKRRTIFSFLRRILKFLLSRMVIVGLLLIAELCFLFFVLLRCGEYLPIVYSFSAVLGVLCVCRIIRTDENPGYKITWIIFVLLTQPFGTVVYVVFSSNKLSRRTKREMSRITALTSHAADKCDDVLREIAAESENAGRQSRYIADMACCPPYKNTESLYLPTGEVYFERMCEILRMAEKYIFIEYFIIAQGEMWDSIYEILREKAAHGVDVRVIYDDVGSIMRLPYWTPRQLYADGIQCTVFHPFIPVLDARQNNRDHRKICVVDGKYALTGGINIGDEYCNRISRFGYWKDNGVLLRGEAAWSFTVMFLTIWDYLIGGTHAENYDEYRPDPSVWQTFSGAGYVQPYTDNPLDDEALAENIYLHILYHATRYVWITTPYLIIDEQMKQALCTAAKSGVDVRIITPGIPDKKTVNETTKAYYAYLLKNGVKVYEYTPGFLHAKTFLCDDLYGTVGSVNLDFRSLYLHFECGVWLYKTPCLADMKTDFVRMFADSREITAKDCKVGLLRDLFRSVLEIMSPLM